MKKKFLVAGVFGVLFIWLAVMLKIVDVQAIGPEGSSVGFAGINKAVFGFFGEHEFWDKVTDFGAGICISMGLGLAILGLAQIISRKGLGKMDRELWALVGLYAVMMVFYVAFEKAVINYRPILESDGTLEASFPSTHTLTSCVLAGSLYLLIPLYGKGRSNPLHRKLLRALCVVLMLVVPLGRIFAGMHWLTDVMGGYFLSFALLFGYAGVLDLIAQKKKETKKKEVKKK